MKIRTLSAAALSILGFAGFAHAQQGGYLYFEGDLVRGVQRGAPGPGCVLANEFKRLEKVTWRIRVLQDGRALDDKGLKSLTVELPDGQRFPARFGPHPPPSRGPATDYFWAAIWVIPTTYPSGTFAYKVIATDLEGRTQTWEPFKEVRSQLTVIPGQIELKP
jgi:hypothetical protein